MNRRPHELLAGAIVCVLAALLMGWGFSPHRHIHAKAWVQLPPDLQSAWGGDPTVLVRHATSADARKHTDTLEPPRHYLDLNDVLDALPELSSSTELEGMGWQDYRIMVTSIDSTLDPRRFGVLPWQLFWTYRKLVALPPQTPPLSPWTTCCGPQRIWDTTWRTPMCRCTRLGTTTANGPTKPASTPCGKPTMWSTCWRQTHAT